MATTAADAATTKNTDLDQLHDMLIAANEQLNSSLDDNDDPDIAKATITEMREVLHRIDLVQSLLFTAASNDITTAVAKVANANALLTKSLDSITSVTKLVNAVTSFLTLVDQAIDLAKKL
jgi:hypothetical protein